MLKICNAGTNLEQRWILCGRLSGPWVAELRAAWDAKRSQRGLTKCIIDLSDVTFVDENGEELLRAFKHDGAEFIATGIEVKHLLEHL